MRRLLLLSLLLLTAAPGTAQTPDADVALVAGAPGADEVVLQVRAARRLRLSFKSTQAVEPFDELGDPIRPGPRWDVAACASPEAARFTADFCLLSSYQGPLDEERRAQGLGYVFADLDLSYAVSSRGTVFVSLENLLGTRVREAENYYAAQLPDKLAPLDDPDFLPDRPFTFRVGIRFQFD